MNDISDGRYINSLIKPMKKAKSKSPTTPISSLTYHPTQPPEGWRWLKVGEKIRANDAYHYASSEVINEVTASSEVNNEVIHGEMGIRVTAPLLSSIHGSIGQYIRRIGGLHTHSSQKAK
jgi:hypothetical protein